LIFQFYSFETKHKLAQKNEEILKLSMIFISLAVNERI